MDSTQKIIWSMQQAFASLGLTKPTSSSVKNIIGLGLPEAIHTLAPKIDIESQQRIRSQYGHFYSQPCPSLGQASLSQGSYRNALFTHVTTFLQQLQQQGRTLAVATGKSRRGLELALQETQLKGFFKTSRCADETNSKPHPAMVHEILLETQVDSKATVMIGDTEFDLEMAAAAGVASIGVTYGAHSKSRLLKHNPIACVDTVLELMTAFKM